MQCACVSVSVPVYIGVLVEVKADGIEAVSKMEIQWEKNTFYIMLFVIHYNNVLLICYHYLHFQ